MITAQELKKGHVIRHEVLEILVPQFIKEGDHIKVEVETGKYVERLQKK